MRGICHVAASLGRKRFAAVLLVAILSRCLAAGYSAAAASAYAGVGDCAAHFIVDAYRDNGGNIWLASEDHGIFRFNPRPGTDQTARYWQQYTPADGLADATAQSVACDIKGRIWVGSLCHGVTVYNGQNWQRYGLLTDAAKNELAGPIGEHVFSIRVSPLDGSVWLCTNSGIARYEPGYKTAVGNTLTGQWQYYTVAEGLPADDVQTVAFGPHGRVYAATRCDGIAIARPTQADRIALRRHKLLGPLHYKAWRIVKSRYEDQVPLTPTGSGLPSNLLNDILVTPTGTVWVATDAGIAWSSDGGSRWRFVRGGDWLAKDKGLMHPPSRLFVLNAARQVSKTRILSEDYCTCLAQDENGDIWVGHRQTGIDIINPTKNEIIPLKLAATSPDGKPWQQPHKYVDKILMLPKSPPIICCYGGGAFELPTWLAGKANAVPQRDAGTGTGKSSIATTGKPAAMPAAAGVPTKAQLAAEQAKVNTLAKKLWPGNSGPRVIKLDDDWRTEGNWLGRYGTYLAVLCAMKAPHDLAWGAGWDPLAYHALQGPHHSRMDGLRHWVQWLYTDENRVLEMPMPYFDKCRLKGLLKNSADRRREAEWDDHGEAYPSTRSGLGIFCFLYVPPGLYTFAVYSVNKDGHSGPNRYRDYSVELSASRHPATVLRRVTIARSTRWPVLGRGRVCGFWSGQWSVFLVRGPTTVCLRLGRNYSFNTIVSAVMLSLVGPDPAPYFGKITNRAVLAQTSYQAPPPPGYGCEATATRLNLGFGMKQSFNRPVSDEIAEAYCVAASAMRLRSATTGEAMAHRREAATRLGALQSVESELWWLHRYGRAEHIAAANGVPTARSIELHLRWDLDLPHPDGMGFDYVRRSLHRRASIGH